MRSRDNQPKGKGAQQASRFCLFLLRATCLDAEVADLQRSIFDAEMAILKPEVVAK